MADKTLSSDYSEYYEKAAVFPQQLDREELRRFESMLPQGGALDVLDLGCAEGRLAVGLAKAGHKVSVGDIAPSQLRFAEAEAAKAGVKLHGSYLADIEAGIDAFGGKRFDAVFFMDVIEHLKNPVVGLEHLRALLKEDGVLILHTPNGSTPHRFLWHLVRRGPDMDYWNPAKLQDFHFQTYDYLTLEKTLNFIGLKIAEVVPTRITLPRLFSSRLLARWFPLLSDTLLVKCRKVAPIDLDSHIEYWKRTRPVHGNPS
ncbi:MAG: bifunctional 2-polyprenyl-6-hydroxyphenol methylase/3-demethylubiquinol 3-O-methyltransferase UbiG [Fibrobacteres bacterium]|nr:bifunctional 2-polyprenyl-6-hydroxyphenol methylase/3-demethylubiquinol 3-O-methyltransferase UbiG [Fibrobacterota bacterium]